MQNELSGRTSGYPYRRARLCDVLGVCSTTWKWILYDDKGEYLGNFARRCEMEEYARQHRARSHKVGPYSNGVPLDDYHVEPVNALAALKESEL